MKKTITLFSAFLITFFYHELHSQVVINEVSNANTTLLDEDGDADDWIELYNAGGSSANIANYKLSDNLNNLNKWIFPNVSIASHDYLLIMASGKNRTNVPNANAINHWETAVFDTTIWKYYNAVSAAPTSGWEQASFNDNSWLSGEGGIGYADGDDNTVVAATYSVYMRKQFNVVDTSLIAQAILNMDYDDGFIAYLNGVEIARSTSMGGTVGVMPAYNDLSGGHEATMYTGGLPETYTISKQILTALLKPGANMLTVEVHNAAFNSSDLTSRPFLSFGITNNSHSYHPTPSWFIPPTQATGYLHTNFSINGQGEMIYLTNSSGTTIDSINPGNIGLNLSYGRLPDGTATIGIFGVPTPGSTNNGQTLYSGYATDPVFTPPPGFYPTTISVLITIPAGTTVHYTTDGSEPTIGSALYSSGINVGATQTIKAKAFPTSSTVLPSNVVTASYMINETMIGGLPVVCISMDPNDFSVAYNVSDFNNLPIKKSHVEYFDRNLNKQFDNDVNFQLYGHTSVFVTQQKSIELTCSSNYNTSEMDYPLFRERPNITKFKGFALRSEYGGKSGWEGIHTPVIIKHTDIDVAAYEPCHVYINGQYWGEYQMREIANSSWVHNNFGINKDSVDMVHQLMDNISNLNIEAIHGTDTGFVNLRTYMNTHTPNTNDFYDHVTSKLDVENYTDYFTYETYMANWDWFCSNHLNNIKLWRKQGEGANTKWRYLIFDMDYMGGYTEGVNYNTLAYLMTPFGTNIHTDIFNRFLMNDSLKTYFVDRYADLMNTIFQTNSFSSAVLAYRDSSSIAMQKHWIRWAGAWGGSYTSWYNNLAGNGPTVDWDTQRLPIARNQLQSQLGLTGQVNVTLDVVPAGAGRIKISTIIPDGLPWTGVYYHGVPVRITAIANPGYTFAYWGANNTTAQNTNASIYYDIAVNDAFTAHFTGSPLDPKLTFSEINYNPIVATGAGDWVEIHNYENLAINLTGWYLKDMNNNHRFDIPFGTVLQPNGYLVVSCDTAKFKLHHPAVTNFVGQPTFSFSNTGDQIRLFDFNNNLKISVIYDEALPWPQGANGGGKTLELADSSNLNVPTSWFDGCPMGSPGEAYTPNCVTSLKQNIKNNDQVIVYPNPFSTSATIKINSSATNQIFIMYDELGNQIQKLKVVNSKMEIQRGDLAKGIYFYRVTSDQGIVGKGKIIIE